MKKLMSRLVAGAVVLSVLAPSASYAATTSNTSTQAQTAQHQHMKQMTQEEREANQAKLMEIIKKYTPGLAGRFQTLFDQQEKVRTQVDAIREQVKAGTLTKEQAQAQLKELGVDFGLGRGHQDPIQQILDAAAQNEEAIVKELITQFLDRMQN